MNPDLLIHDLFAIQQRHGYLPEQEIRALVERTETSLARVEELRSFYPHLRCDPPPSVELEICRDVTCHLRGATKLIEELGKEVENAGSLRLDEYDLRVMSSVKDFGGLPREGKNLIVLAAINELSCFSWKWRNATPEL